jgi:RNA polymerase sigma-70 factor (ECF subfamily)
MKPRLVLQPGSPAPTRALEPIEVLYSEHLSQVKRWARRLAGPAADLEDLVHDVFLVALRRGFESRGEASVDTWLFSITQRVVWGKRQRARLRQWLLGRNREELVPPSPQTPHHELERRERSVRLYRALDQVSEAYRTTLILYELEELSGEEVARLTGVPLGTVWVRLHRGRERLVKILARDGQS